MQRFPSQLSEPPHDQRVGVSPSGPHTPPMDGDSNQSSLGRAQFEISEETAPKKNAARQRLNGLASLRIHHTSIIFTSEEFHVSGGKADVAQATFRRDKGSDEEVVAVKKLRSHEGTNQKKFSNEFVHEVVIMAALSHKNVVRLVGFVEDLENGRAWIVLSWAPNGNVSEFLATGKWEIPERVSLIQDTFEGINYLHTRQPPICHGDLKSLNILVSSSYRAIITDFGSARAITESEDIPSNEEHDQQAQRNPTMGRADPRIHVGAVGNQLTLTGPAWSLRWAPPEVMDGERPSLSTDIWAGGWICWEVMTDKVPFHEVNSAGAITLMVIQGEVPETREDAQLAQITRLCSLMEDCWAFNPRARPNIARCCMELQWIPSLPPSSGKADRRAPSIELLLEMGQMHYHQARPEKAAALFQEVLSLARSAGNQIATAKALKSLGDVYQLQCRYTQAEESYTRAQELYAIVRDDWRRAATLNGLGHVYRRQSKYTQAEESYTRAQEIFARIGADHGRANAFLGVGHVYRLQSKYTQAEELFTRAQEIYTRIGDDQGRANTLFGLGDIYRVQSKYSQAEESFITAQETYARIGDDRGRANTLYGLGEVYRLQSKFTQVEQLFTRAQEIYTRIGDDQGRANMLDGLGDVYYLQSKYTQAEESLTLAQETYARIGDDRGRANTMYGLGEIYRVQSNYTQAEELFTRAEEIYTRISYDQGRANTLCGLGHVYRLQSKSTQADESYTRAQEIYTRIGHDLGRANVQRGLGHLRRKQGRNAEAALLYTEAKDIYAQIGRTDDEEDAAHWRAVLSPEQYSSTP